MTGSGPPPVVTYDATTGGVKMSILYDDGEMTVEDWDPKTMRHEAEADCLLDANSLRLKAVPVDGSSVVAWRKGEANARVWSPGSCRSAGFVPVCGRLVVARASRTD